MLKESLSVFFLLSYIKVLDGVKCAQCMGLTCDGPKCNGDYCMVSKFGFNEIIKGCISGDLLKNTLNDHCKRFEEIQNDFQMCLCNDAHSCNTHINQDEIKIEKLKLSRCACTSPNCTSNVCIGEFCTYSFNEKDADPVVKGCSNQTMPLIDRIIEGSCVTPQISMMHTRKDIAAGGKGRQSCFCSGHYCNNQKLQVAVKDSVTCDMAVDINSGRNTLQTELGKCKGEYCFNVAIIEDNMYFKSRGCISYVDDRKVPEEINDHGCMHFKSGTTEIKACFGKRDQKNNPFMNSNCATLKINGLIVILLLCCTSVKYFMEKF